MSLSARRAWIEMEYDKIGIVRNKKSLSARRAWIEITMTFPWIPVRWVALRKESVDRNNDKPGGTLKFTVVALRKESVDRNTKSCTLSTRLLSVALRKESVDRNLHLKSLRQTIPSRSPQGERG